MNFNRTILFFLMCLTGAVCTWAGVAKIRVPWNGKNMLLQGQGGVDYLVLTSDLNSLELEYHGTASSANWYNIRNLRVPAYENLRTISADDETYLVIAGQDTAVVTVINYEKYKIQNLQIDAAQPNECNAVNLTVTGPLIHYLDSTGQKSLPRKLGIMYRSLSWDGQKWQDTTLCYDFNHTKEVQQVTVPAPLQNTTFCLKDYYADSLSLPYDSLCTQEYSAVAVDCRLTNITVARLAGNELDRPDSSTVNGSGPLEIEFKSNPTPAVKYFEWRINKGTDRIATRQDETTRYTFQEAGATYTVGLTVRNDLCEKLADSVSISVTDSYLQVPNVFTPNGDGQNDEFRVAYKSIREFHCYVYNRWGRKVYSSSDIQKGWDGKINGQNAAMGTYFYVIKAVGEDGKKYFKSGDINLLR